MNLHFIIREEALDDVEQAVRWYEEQKSGLGEEFMEELFECFEFIHSRPFTFARKFQSFREMPMQRFPFAIVYNVGSSEVVIVSVCHYKRQTRRKPQKK